MDVAGVKIVYDEYAVNFIELREYTLGVKAIDNHGNQSEATLKIVGTE